MALLNLDWVKSVDVGIGPGFDTLSYFDHKCPELLERFDSLCALGNQGELCFCPVEIFLLSFDASLHLPLLCQFLDDLCDFLIVLHFLAFDGIVSETVNFGLDLV